MPRSRYRARQVGGKTHEVVDYHRDDSRPGKPLHIMVPGGLIALAVLGLIIYIAYQWFEGQMNDDTTLILIGLLSPFYVGGVFLFSYGYELYNIPRALRLTAIIVFVTLAAVVIVAVFFFILKDGKIGSSSKSSSSSDSKSSSSSSSRSSSSKSGSGGGTKPSYSGTARSSSIGDGIFIGGSDRVIRTRETREVVREVEVPVAPRSVDCPFCKRSYVPSEQNYACPSCGAATPKELIEQSEAPKKK